MINFIAGKLEHKAAPLLVVEANGVGYEIQATLSAIASLPAVGSPVKLLTHFVVREDAQLLFGFANNVERSLFRELIKVSGVGPKLALAILSGMDVQGFNRCILGKDIRALTQLPGVGKKTAERLVIEMKDRLPEAPSAVTTEGGEASSQSQRAILIAEAETALVALGYKPVEASRAIAKLDVDEDGSAEQLIRAALQAMLHQ